jgi:septal ring factor EnvC (AmiA/AmiB activator)
LSRRWQLAWFLAGLLLLAFYCALPAHPQDSTESRPSELIESLQRRLQTISAYAASLETELSSWKRLSSESAEQAQQLLRELGTLRAELQSWQSASEDSQRQVAELTRLWRESETRLQQVLQSSQSSADSWRAAIDGAARDLRRAKGRGVVVAIIAALVGGGIGYAIAQ